MHCCHEVFIDGSTSGLGLSLRNILSSLDHEIVSIDRSSKFNQTKKDYQILINDLYDLDKLSDSLSSNIDLLSSINTCIFNAGTLGLIEAANEISCEKLLHTFTINCLSVKIILDFMLKILAAKILYSLAVALLSPYTGWLEYCSTKSFTDSMFRVYAKRIPPRFLFRYLRIYQLKCKILLGKMLTFQSFGSQKVHFIVRIRCSA